MQAIRIPAVSVPPHLARYFEPALCNSCYVCHTVLFLREIRRVLKDDGVVFWNVGDSYAANRTYQVTDSKWCDVGNTMGAKVPDGLKPKDMCLIPFRVALAAQADGWWVRSDIIWAKPNPMPESVRDRPTSSYEHIFLFTKSKDYYWDQDAVREANLPVSLNRVKYGLHQRHPAGVGIAIPPVDTDVMGTRFCPENGRNLRDAWTIATQPSGFKHYAAFPLELPTRCIKAATRPGDTVLDPFCGTGRTLYAALKLGRNAVGYDLSEKYCEMSTSRCREVQPILTLRPMGNTIN